MVINTWVIAFFLAWLLSMVSFLVYASYRGWLEFWPLSSLARPRQYLLVRCSRTFTLLFISVSLIAFLYYETGVFEKRIPEFKIELTREQYESSLRERSRIFGDKMKYATGIQAEILKEQKSYFDDKLSGIEKAYASHIAMLAAHSSSLKKIYKQASAELLNKARKAIAAGDLTEADVLLEAVENTARLDGDTAGRLAWARGYLAEESGDFSGAYEHYSRVVRFMPDNNELELHAGWLALNLGDYKTSRSHYEAVLIANVRQHGENHPEVAGNYKSLGTVSARMGNYREARVYFEKALLIDFQSYGADHPEVAGGHFNVAWAHRQMGAYRDAIPHLEKALNSNLKNYGVNDSRVIRGYALLGDTWEDLEDYRRSVMYYEKALNAASKVYGEGHVEVADYNYHLGWLRGKLAEYDQAVFRFERALEVYRRHYPEDHPDVLSVKRNLKVLRSALR